MNIHSSLVRELHDKEYREAFVASQISIGLPFQIRALRKNRMLTQPDLAKLASMSQPRISELETPGARNLSLDTLQRIAAAFDVALQVSFVPFSKLVDNSELMELENFSVVAFFQEIDQIERSPIREPSAIYETLNATKQSITAIPIRGTSRDSNWNDGDEEIMQVNGGTYGALSSIAS